MSELEPSEKQALPQPKEQQAIPYPEAYLKHTKELACRLRRVEKRMRFILLCTRFLAAGGAILIPILNNIHLHRIHIWSLQIDDPAKAAVTIVGLIVALAIAYEGTLHYEERFLGYARTARYLESQLAYFETRSGAYANLSDKSALQKLVPRVEEEITIWRMSSLNALRQPEHPQTEQTKASTPDSG